MFRGRNKAKMFAKQLASEDIIALACFHFYCVAVKTKLLLKQAGLWEIFKSVNAQSFIKLPRNSREYWKRLNILAHPLPFDYSKTVQKQATVVF